MLNVLIVKAEALVMYIPGESNTEWPPRRDVDRREERVIVWHRDGPALRVDSLLRFTVPAVQDGVLETFIDGGEGDVMVQELSKLHDHEGVTGVKV